MESRTAKIALIVLLISSVCWLGGINIRAMIGFDLLQPGTLDFKPNIHPFVERAVFALIAQSSVIVNLAYVIAWCAGILYLRTAELKLKQHGWLLMCAILFYLFTPVEIYTMVLDVRIWYLDYIGSNDLVEFRKLFIHRLAALSGVPMIALLCYYTILVLTIVRPLQRKPGLSSTTSG
ncbi:MAG: hypothetical protein HYR76_07705 [Ignavibacteria bacterium]|nr:hypothetical protein [Ignavibacteria bacterium]MBI3765440.1 hypothetical protein [Ignavibacteriales bacterium]